MYNMPMDAMILAGCTPEPVGQAGRFGDWDDDEEDLDVVETVSYLCCYCSADASRY
jgi:hypothetical protein